LKLIADHVTEYAMLMTKLIVFTMGLYTIIVLLISSDKSFFSIDILKAALKVAIIGICIIIVAIPEGLPVAVSIAMALSSN
jgi:magnesium-transporting ATPase (P-type)